MRYKVFILPIIILLSCNRYIDAKNKKVQILEGSFTSSSGSNTLVYRTSVGLKMDNVVLKPKPFQVKLPKKMKYYELVGPSDFAFYYNQSQVVFIKINLENARPVSDTSYAPSLNELNIFIQQLSTVNNKKHNIKEMTSKTERINRIMIKEDATILLYNYLKENEGLFSNHLNSFTFLSQ